MKITIMNASPKGTNSASQELIDRLIPYFKKKHEYGILQVNPEMKESFAVAAVNASDAVILVAPIYFSGLPSSAVALMDILEAKVQKKDLKVAAIVQCGFYEKENTEPAMELIRNWCTRNGYTFTGGIGMGGGGALQSLHNMETGEFLLSKLEPAYIDLIQGLVDGKEKVNFFSLPVPKWIYRMSANRMWKKQAEANGLEGRDLSRRPRGHF